MLIWLPRVLMNAFLMLQRPSSISPSWLHQAPALALSRCVSQLGAGPDFNYIWKKVHIQKNINSHHLRVKSLNMLYVIYGVAGCLPGAKMIENKDKVEKRKIRVDFRSIYPGRRLLLPNGRPFTEYEVGAEQQFEVADCGFVVTR